MLESLPGCRKAEMVQTWLFSLRGDDLRLRERRLRRAKPNERARLLYRYLLRLHKQVSSAVPEEAAELARKAAYSQYELNDEELSCLRQYYDRQRGVLRYYSFWKRLWCKYVLALI